MGPTSIKRYDKYGIILRLLLHGEFIISGFTSRDFRRLMPGKTTGQVSRLSKRLHVHGFIKKIGKRYKYYLTPCGKQVAATALKLCEMTAIPHFAQALA